MCKRCGYNKIKTNAQQFCNKENRKWNKAFLAILKRLINYPDSFQTSIAKSMD